MAEITMTAEDHAEFLSLLQRALGNVDAARAHLAEGAGDPAPELLKACRSEIGAARCALADAITAFAALDNEEA
jgi:hypothetical protein